MIKPCLWATDLIISFSSEMLKNFNEASGSICLIMVSFHKNPVSLPSHEILALSLNLPICPKISTNTTYNNPHSLT